MVECAHGVECVGYVRCTHGNGRLCLCCQCIRVSEANANSAFRSFSDYFFRARQLRCNGHHSNFALRSIPELVEYCECWRGDVSHRMNPTLRRGYERAFQMYTQRSCPDFSLTLGRITYTAAQSLQRSESFIH